MALRRSPARRSRCYGLLVRLKAVESGWQALADYLRSAAQQAGLKGDGPADELVDDLLKLGVLERAESSLIKDLYRVRNVARRSEDDVSGESAAVYLAMVQKLIASSPKNN